MATNFVQDGHVLDLAAPYDRTSGQGALIGSIFGVAISTVTSGSTGQFGITGVWNINKGSGACTVGLPAYWDNSTREITPVPNGTVPVGLFAESVLTGATKVKVLLTPFGPRKISVSTELTGNGSAQNFAHGLGVVPSAVFVVPTDLTPATVGSFVVTEGTHTSTNAVVTVTTNKKYKVIAIA